MEEKYVKYGKSVATIIFIVLILLGIVLFLDSRIDESIVNDTVLINDTNELDVEDINFTLEEEVIENITFNHSDDVIENISLNNESILNESIE